MTPRPPTSSMFPPVHYAGMDLAAPKTPDAVADLVTCWEMEQSGGGWPPMAAKKRYLPPPTRDALIQLILPRLVCSRCWGFPDEAVGLSAAALRDLASRFADCRHDWLVENRPGVDYEFAFCRRCRLFAWDPKDKVPLAAASNGEYSIYDTSSSDEETDKPGQKFHGLRQNA